LQTDFKLSEGRYYHERPSLEVMTRSFRPARLTAFVAGLFFTVLFVIIWSELFDLAFMMHKKS
jgi:hypothetical protein